MQVGNMDETGITNVHKPRNIIATKGSKSVGKIISGEKGRTVTVICASNAAGGYIPPMIIFPRKRMVDSLMHNAPVGAIGHCTNSGGTDVESFMKSLKHFSSIAKPCKKNTLLYWMDIIVTKPLKQWSFHYQMELKYLHCLYTAHTKCNYWTGRFSNH